MRPANSVANFSLNLSKVWAMSGWFTKAAALLAAWAAWVLLPVWLPEAKPCSLLPRSTVEKASNSFLSASMSSGRNCVSIMDKTAKVLMGCTVADAAMAAGPAATCMLRMSTVLMALPKLVFVLLGCSVFKAWKSAVETATLEKPCSGSLLALTCCSKGMDGAATAGKPFIASICWVVTALGKALLGSDGPNNASIWSGSRPMAKANSLRLFSSGVVCATVMMLMLGLSGMVVNSVEPSDEAAISDDFKSVAACSSNILKGSSACKDRSASVRPVSCMAELACWSATESSLSFSRRLACCALADASCLSWA